jgi:hypothetical protein
MNKQEIIDTLKIITNIILIMSLVAVVFVMYNYDQEIEEVLGDKNPDRIISYYEERTGLVCKCYDSKDIKLGLINLNLP